MQYLGLNGLHCLSVQLLYLHYSHLKMYIVLVLLFCKGDVL